MQHMIREILFFFWSFFPLFLYLQFTIEQNLVRKLIWEILYYTSSQRPFSHLRLYKLRFYSENLTGICILYFVSGTERESGDSCQADTRKAEASGRRCFCCWPNYKCYLKATFYSVLFNKQLTLSYNWEQGNVSVRVRRLIWTQVKAKTAVKLFKTTISRRLSVYLRL